MRPDGRAGNQAAAHDAAVGVSKDAVGKLGFAALKVLMDGLFHGSKIKQHRFLLIMGISVGRRHISAAWKQFRIFNINRGGQVCPPLR